ncbi:LOW QUALITY PROTEIN: MAPK/MAK/MRK overlapping kinase [Porphyrio hochstetteri]
MNKDKPAGKIGEGTFSDVLKTPSFRVGKYYACKPVLERFVCSTERELLLIMQGLPICLKWNRFYSLLSGKKDNYNLVPDCKPVFLFSFKFNFTMEQVNNLRNIQVLRRLSPHLDTLVLHEVAVDKKAGSLSRICELMDMNIYELIKGMRKPLPENKIIENYMNQLCKSLDHIYSCCLTMGAKFKFFPVLMQNTVKLGDFRYCRSIYSEQPHTEYIFTLWSQAPEYAYLQMASVLTKSRTSFTDEVVAQTESAFAF